MKVVHDKHFGLDNYTTCMAKIGKKTKINIWDHSDNVTCEHCLKIRGVVMVNGKPEKTEYELNRMKERKVELLTQLTHLYYIFTGKEYTPEEMKGISDRLDERFETLDSL